MFATGVRLWVWPSGLLMTPVLWFYIFTLANLSRCNTYLITLYCYCCLLEYTGTLYNPITCMSFCLLIAKFDYSHFEIAHYMYALP